MLKVSSIRHIQVHNQTQLKFRGRTIFEEPFTVHPKNPTSQQARVSVRDTLYT